MRSTGAQGPHTALHRGLPALVTALVLGLGLSTAGMLAAAAPAYAGRRTVLDERGDALKRVGGAEPRVAPQHRSADVVRFVTIMTRQRLVLTTTTRALPGNFWAVLWAVRTDLGATYDVDVMRTGPIASSLSTGGVEVACEGLRRDVDRRRARVSVSVPLSCLGEPTSVQTGSGAAATDRDFGRVFIDDAARAAEFRNGDLALGRTVRRG